MRTRSGQSSRAQVRREAPEARIAVDETPGDPRDLSVRIDLVVLDPVPHALELDGAEQKLRGPRPGARRGEPREPAGKMDERDPHATRREATELRFTGAPPAHATRRPHPGTRPSGGPGGRAIGHHRDIPAPRPHALEPQQPRA